MITASAENSAHLADFMERMTLRRHKLIQGCQRRDRLDFAGHPDAKCLLLKAPRGFGKSVQIAHCAQAATDRREQCVYLDLSSFWEANQSEAEFIAKAIVAVLSPSDSPETDTGCCPTTFALRLLLGQKRPVTICLDGVADSSATQRLLKAISLETPDSVRLVVSERLPGALAALSVIPEVVTLGARDLSFSFDEVCSLLPGESGRAKKIFTMTDGWPLLCALARKLKASGEAFVHLPEVQAYFETDVLAQISPPLRDCLTNASWLEEITAEAEDYVFKVSDSGRSLAELVSRHGLLTPGVDKPNCYEMNRALQAYLRNRFIETNGYRRSNVLKRIAFWHWRRKEYRLAIEAALRAQDHSWARRLTDEVLLDLALRQGEIEALTVWFTGIRRSELFQTPSLAIGYAWVLYFSQRAAEAEDVLVGLKHLRTSASPEQDDSKGWAELVHAIGLATHDELRESDERCAAWVDTYGSINPAGKAAAQTCRAFVAASGRHFDILPRRISSATIASGAVRHRYAFGWIAAAQVQAKLLIGDIAGARREVRRAKADENVAYDRSPFVKGMMAAFEFQVQAEDGSPSPDEKTVQDALDFSMKFGVTDVVWGTVRCAAETYIRHGDKTRAFSLLERCRLLAKERGLNRLGVLVRLGTEVFAMGTGTETALAAEPLPSDEDLLFLPNHKRAIQAEIALLEASRFLRDGKSGLAERYARKALSNFAAVKDQRGEIRAQFTVAIALYLMGEEKQALKRISDANLKARQLGALTTLANRRYFLRVVCRNARAFIDKSTTEISMVEEPARGIQVNGRRNEKSFAPLGQKQVSVLQHAALGLRNKEIAVRMHVTEDAVKWHFRQILRDLKVSNRTEAVVVARSLGLI
ncbi:LuxR C-terminal-related transcriptional regulator [Hoeflea sp.]|uniref:helix-turn-helix transcriptional regulator n=1 Tax=Hoeflea sp. TaxID=1940281 RepID=UPI0019A8C8C0|nr:LuxR C-terminal-related transcriptional regulator [Hoeflea sp.]MBC7285025.1 helix-turn-helix transcriptional regulator [Hoeflea sp.]